MSILKLDLAKLQTRQGDLQFMVIKGNVGIKELKVRKFLKIFIPKSFADYAIKFGHVKNESWILKIVNPLFFY